MASHDLSKSLQRPAIEVIGSREVLVLVLKAGESMQQSARKMGDLIIGSDLIFDVAMRSWQNKVMRFIHLRKTIWALCLNVGDIVNKRPS